MPHGRKKDTQRAYRHQPRAGHNAALESHSSLRVRAGLERVAGTGGDARRVLRAGGRPASINVPDDGGQTHRRGGKARRSRYADKHLGRSIQGGRRRIRGAFANARHIGHRYIINETGMLFNLDYDRRQDADFVYAREPGIGWHGAWDAFYFPATFTLNDELDASLPPPKGFLPYRGANTYQDASDKDAAQDNYVERCKRQVKDIIENSLLASLDGSTRAAIVADIGGIARDHCEAVDRFYNKNKKVLPARWYRKYDQDVGWTIARVIFRRDWRTIARESRTLQKRIEQAVRRTIEKIHVPNGSAFFGKPGRRKIGKSHA